MITGIIVQYFEYRRAYLAQILRSYENHKYILWNNDPQPITGAINSPKNYHSAIKYNLGMLADTERILIQDNDLVVPLETIDKLYVASLKHPDSIIGCHGRKLVPGDNPYFDGPILNLENHTIDGEYECEIIVGRVQMMRRELLPNICKYMMKYFSYNEDDIIASLANIKAGNKNYVIAAPVLSLPELGQGYCHEKRHYGDRNEICKKILKDEIL